MKKFRLFPKEDGYIPHLWLSFYYFSCLNVFYLEGFAFWSSLFVLSAIFFCYREFYWRPERSFSLALVLTLLVFYLVLFISQSFFYVLLYGVNMLYGVKKPWKFWVGYTVINAVTSSMLLSDILGLRDYLWGYITPGILISIITPAVWKVQDTWYRKWETVNHELAEANQRVEELIKERERDRIARDLHDTVGQTLSTISVKSDISKKLLYQKPEQAEQELRDIQQLSRSLLKEMREIVSDLRLVSLEEEVKATQRRLKEAGIVLELEQQVDLTKDSSKETMLAYIIKEAVTNVIRHSSATFCKIRVIESEIELLLEVEDNGIFKSTELQEGNGMNGIRKRVRLMNGKADFKTSQSGGFHLSVKVPMQKEGGNVNDSYAIGG